MFRYISNTFKSIKTHFQHPESNWVKFWDLFQNVENEYKTKISIKPLLKLFSFYKTVKIIILSDIEVFINKNLLKLLTPIQLENNKILLPVFIQDTKYFICIDQVSEVRDYDVIDCQMVSGNVNIDLKHVFNRLISSKSSPYQVSFINPSDLGLEDIEMTVIRNENIETNKYQNKEYIN
jgi:hypothetical protein